MTKEKFFSPEQKVAMLRKQLLGNVPASDLCDQYRIHPSVFYRWQRAYFRELGGIAETTIHCGDKLAHSDTIDGPTIIEEATTTIVIPPRCVVDATKHGDYSIDIAE